MLAKQVAKSKTVAIGAEAPRIIDGTEKVKGGASYIADIELPGMLYCAILRSGVAHGIIEKLNYEKLLSFDFVKAVITGKNSRLNNIGYLKDNPPLKYPKVRSFADEVLAVAATDYDKALKALDEIEVRYKELPAVFDLFEALQPNAPLVHEENGSNLVNINFDVVSGNTERAFKESYLVREDVFNVPRVAFAPLGTLGAISYLDQSGNLVLISNTQEPYQLKRELASSLGLELSKVKIYQPYIGGSFGRGMDIHPFEVIVCALTLKTKRPVKILFSRDEDFRFSPTRQPLFVKVKSGTDKEGRLLARKVEAFLDTGAYVSWGAFDARVMASTTTGLYKVRNVEFRAKVVYTNNLYTINMRGAGNPQITFAIESHMDALAEELGIDPLEFRLLNAYEGRYKTPQGMTIRNAKLKTVLKRCGELIGWRGRHELSSKDGKKYGIGFAALFHVGGGARVYKTDGAGAFIKADDDGGVTLFTGMTEIGQGSANTLAQIVASELAIPLEKVRVVYLGDADTRPWDTATHASRTTYVCGTAALRAARKLKKMILKEASKLLNEDVRNLTIEEGVVKSNASSASIELGKLIRSVHFRKHGKTFAAYDYFDPPSELANEENKGNISADYANAAQAALVEVDTESGFVKVLKVVSVHSVGRVVNPKGAASQVIGGIVQGLGHALFEELIFEKGVLLNSGFSSYEVPTLKEVPEIIVEFLNEPSTSSPLGALGVAENGIIPIAAAISNAIYDAIGVRINSIPFKPEKILKALNRL